MAQSLARGRARPAWRPGPGVDFTDLPAAVAAAADGDLILVEDGVYSPFTVAGKALAIVGEAGASARVAGPVVGAPLAVVRDLGPAQSVLLQGLELDNNAPVVPFEAEFPGAALEVRDCAGPVWVEGCRIEKTGAGGVVHAVGADALTLVRCTLAGGTSFITTAPFQTPLVGSSPLSCP